MATNDNMTDFRKQDLNFSYCCGLVGGRAQRVGNNQYVFAKNVIRDDGPFYCPECFSDVIVRKCVEREDHFAHKGNLSKLFGSNESLLHKSCKEEILKGLVEQFPDGKWEIERPIRADDNKGYLEVVPDISGRIGKEAVAIEIQRSSLNIKTIVKRTQEYTKRRVAILWVVPLKEDLPNENFRPRLFEQFLHLMYYHRVYYWQKGYGAKVLPVHFHKEKRYIEESRWFDSETKEEKTAGGYWKTYKTIKKPIFWKKLIDIRTDFISDCAKEWIDKNEKLNVPSRLLFKDNLRKWWDNSR